MPIIYSRDSAVYRKTVLLTAVYWVTFGPCHIFWIYLWTCVSNFGIKNYSAMTILIHVTLNINIYVIILDIE